jgi:phage-related protein
MSNIYSVSEWGNSEDYRKNEIVQVDDDYYYCVTAHTSSAGGDFPSTSLNLWHGYETYSSNGLVKPYFMWVPSYNISVNHSPRVKTVKFGDGWEQRMNDGLNNTLLELDLAFDNRDLYESAAITHFLDTRGGSESFIWYPPQPYQAQKLWVCENHTFNINFYNNYSIKARFREVVY